MFLYGKEKKKTRQPAVVYILLENKKKGKEIKRCFSLRHPVDAKKLVDKTMSYSPIRLSH